MKHLIVHAEPGQVGFLHCDEFGRMSFEYCESWVRDPHGFPLSASLPYTSDLQTAPAAHRFFANLLPEAGVRDAVCRRLGISANNDFELLARIGGECAGALSVLPEGVAPDADVGDYEEIHPEEIASWARLPALICSNFPARAFAICRPTRYSAVSRSARPVSPQ